MNLKDPEKEFFDDFEHKVTDKIKKYGDRPNFPKLEDYGIERGWSWRITSSTSKPSWIWVVLLATR